MSTTQLPPVEPGNRIQLPTEWADALGIYGQVALERTSQGILVRPCPSRKWDEFFATSLLIGSAPANEQDEELEVTGDGLLF